MVQLSDLQRVGPFEWEIPTSARSDMRVPARIFISRELLEAIGDDASLEQAANAATLPGVIGRVLVMPDVHQGYGFPIGGVAATELPSGVISPGAIGYDINCGVRLLASKVELEAARGVMNDLVTALDAACPSGVGTSGRLRLGERELERAGIQGHGVSVFNGGPMRTGIEGTPRTSHFHAFLVRIGFRGIDLHNVEHVVHPAVEHEGEGLVLG